MKNKIPFLAFILSLLCPIMVSAAPFQYSPPPLYTGVETTTIDNTSNFFNLVTPPSFSYDSIDQISRTFDDVDFRVDTVSFSSSSFSTFSVIGVNTPYYSIYDIYYRPIFNYLSLYVVVNVYDSSAVNPPIDYFPESLFNTSFFLNTYKVENGIVTSEDYDIPLTSSFISSSIGSSNSSRSYLIRVTFNSSEPIYFSPQSKIWFNIAFPSSIQANYIDIGFPGGFLGISSYYSTVYGSDPNWQAVLRDLPSVDLMLPPDFSQSGDFEYVASSIFDLPIVATILIPIGLTAVSWFITSFLLHKGIRNSGGDDD